MQLMQQRGGAEHLHRRAEVLKNIGYHAGAAEVTIGDSEPRLLRELLVSDDAATEQTAARAKGILVAYAGERLISNTTVRWLSILTGLFADVCYGSYAWHACHCCFI